MASTLTLRLHEGRPRKGSSSGRQGQEVRLPTKWDLVSTMEDCMPYFERGLQKEHRWLTQDAGSQEDSTERVASPKQVPFVFR